MANVPPDKASAAAEELAAYSDRFTQFDVRMERFEGSLRLLRWMVGALFPLLIAVVLKLFLP